MKPEVKMTYYLVLEDKPGDFMNVDLREIAKHISDGNNKNYDTIEAIDSFTMNYTKQELYDLIRKVNVVPERYLLGDLKVINSNKYRYPVLTKTPTFTINDLFTDYLEDKIVINKLLNIINKYSQEVFLKIKEALLLRDVQTAYASYLSLSYLVQRNIFFYINENILASKRVLIREKNTDH